MKSFKTFNESADLSEGIRLKSPSEYAAGLNKARERIGGAYRATRDFLNPPRSKSADPVVRAGGSYTGRGGAPVLPDKTDSKSDAKTNSKTDSKEKPKATKEKPKATTKDSSNYSGEDATKDQEAAKQAAEKKRQAKQNPPSNSRPPSRPEKSTAKTDSRNSAYIKDRASISKAKTPEAKAKATEKASATGESAWAKANPKLAAAKKKRDATRGTSKSTNPLMQKYIKDRKCSNAANEKARQDAKAASIAQSPNADKINKKETAIKDNIKSSMRNQALSDRAKAKQGLDPSKPTPKDQLPKGAQQARTGVPKTDSPAVKAPPKVQPPAATSKPSVTPTPTAKSTVKIGDKVGYSKGGEVQKKTKKESFLGFADYLAEKKTKIKLNPKKDDLLEGGCGSYSKGGDVKKNHGEDCDCIKCEKKRRKDDLGDEKTVSTEDYVYVSQEEVSEESYQEEGYETETDLTEKIGNLPGSTNAAKPTVNNYNSKKDFKSAFKSNPGAFKSPLGSMGGGKIVGNRFQVDADDDEQGFVPIPQMPRGRPGQYGTGAGSMKPMSAFTQKMMYKSPLFGGSKGRGNFYKAAMKANNVQIGTPKPKPNSSPASSSSSLRPNLRAPKPTSQSILNKRKGLKASMREAIDQVYEDRSDDAKASLEKVKKRQGVLDDYEKKTGKKLDINKSVEGKDHKKNFPGAKRTDKKVKGAKETELETHNRRVGKYSERLLKYGKTKKQKRDDDAMAKHASRFD